MDEEVALLKVQSFCRFILARKETVRRLNERFGRFYDEESGYDFYMDMVDGTSSWWKPRLLWESELEYYYAQMQDQPDVNCGENDNGQDQQELMLLPQPKPAPPASTQVAMRKAWRVTMPEEDNLNDALLIRVDCYVSESPYRVLLIHSEQEFDIAYKKIVALTKNSEQEDEFHEIDDWVFDFSFFAFDRPVPDSTKYTVWNSDQPLRSMVKMEIKENEKGELSQTNGWNNLTWRKTIEFWAFYSPIKDSCRLNVQQVPNPIRHRIATSSVARGGWSQLFPFFAFTTVRHTVLEAVGCEKHLKRCKIRPVQHEELDSMFHPVESLEYEFDVEEEGKYEDQEEQAYDPSNSVWCKRFEFIGFTSQFPGTTKFAVLKKTQELLSIQDELEKKQLQMESKLTQFMHYPTYKIVAENTGDITGWEEISHFYAFPVPFPGTTRYYFMTSRKPTRYMLSLHDQIGGKWETLFTFYAFSPRPQDYYDPTNVRSTKK